MFNIFHRGLLTLAFLVGAQFLIAAPSQAKIFRNAYVSFELPETWKCVLEQTEWVCRSEIDKQSKEAIIILTAKEVGPTDSFDAYANHISSPMSLSAKTAGVPSKVIYAPKQVMYNDHPWVDGLHLGSEVPNYFTRYLATIKDKVAVLVTLSAHKDHYTKYSPDFFKAVSSLRVVASKNLLAQPGALRPGENELLGTGVSAAVPGNMDGMEPMPSSSTSNSQGGKTKLILIILGVFIFCILGFVFYKLRR